MEMTDIIKFEWDKREEEYYVYKNNSTIGFIDFNMDKKDLFKKVWHFRINPSLDENKINRILSEKDLRKLLKKIERLNN